MTPADIEAEARRLRDAWHAALCTTGDHSAAWLAVAEASLRAWEEHERQRDEARHVARMLVGGLTEIFLRATGRAAHPHPREALEQVAGLVRDLGKHKAATHAIAEALDVPESVPVADLPRYVASAIQIAAEVERDQLLAREEAVAFREARAERAVAALEAALASPGLVPLQIACEALGGDVTRCTSEDAARAAIDDRERFLRATGEQNALLEVCYAFGLDTRAIDRAPGGMTVDNVAAAVRRLPKDPA